MNHSTDLSSLIGNFDCGYSIVWNFSHFPVTLPLRDINFGWFQRVKDCHFDNLKALNFDILGVSHLKMSKISKNSKLRLLKWSKWQFLELQNDHN